MSDINKEIEAKHFGSMEPTPKELGLAVDDRPEPDKSNPPGFGGWAIPHFLTFSGLVNAAIRAYRWSFDEALRHSHENALAMRRDPVIFMSLRARQIPLSQLAWKLELPIQPTHPLYDKLSEKVHIVEDAIRRHTFLGKIILALSEAIWYGKAAVHIQYQWSLVRGHRVLTIKDWYPINGDKVRYKWDGTVGIQIFPASGMRAEPSDRWTVHWLTPSEREQFIIHNYEPEDVDFIEFELGGSIKGVGLRSRLYWLWYLKSIVMSYLLTYLERVGLGGVTVFFYEAENKRSFDEVKQLVEAQVNSPVLLFPRRRDGGQGGPGIMRLDNSGAAIAMFHGLVNEYFDNLIQQLILGQQLTYKSGGSGLVGSGIAELHGDTFSRLVKYDAISLADSLTRDLVHIIMRHSFPEISEELYPRFSFIIDPPNADKVLQYATILAQMGIPVDEQQLREITGLIAPKATESIANVNLAPYMASASSLPFMDELLAKKQSYQQAALQQQQPIEQQNIQQ